LQLLSQGNPLDNFDFLFDQNIHFANLPPFFLPSTTLPPQDSFNEFLQTDEWQEPLAALVSVSDSWPSLPAHDTTTQDFGLSDQSHPFDPLCLGRNAPLSVNLLGGYDPSFAQAQPNDPTIMDTPYEPRSLDSSIKGMFTGILIYGHH
jgi:hypothetical protein